jgi:hypothetical protein
MGTRFIKYYKFWVWTLLTNTNERRAFTQMCDKGEIKKKSGMSKLLFLKTRFITPSYSWKSNIGLHPEIVRLPLLRETRITFVNISLRNFLF